MIQAVGFVIGYVKQDFTHTFRAWLLGLVLSIIVSSCEVSFSYDDFSVLLALHSGLANVQPQSCKLAKEHSCETGEGEGEKGARRAKEG